MDHGATHSRRRIRSATARSLGGGHRREADGQPHCGAILLAPVDQIDCPNRGHWPIARPGSQPAGTIRTERNAVRKAIFPSGCEIPADRYTGWRANPVGSRPWTRMDDDSRSSAGHDSVWEPTAVARGDGHVQGGSADHRRCGHRRSDLAVAQRGCRFLKDSYGES